MVIGIIALLMGILLPALARARASARETQCMSNIRQLGMGLQMYCDQNKGLLPADSNNGSKSNPVDFINNYSLSWAGTEMWFNAIPPMLNLPAYYNLISTAPSQGGAPIPGLGDASVFICPSCTSAAIASGETSNVVIGNSSYFLIFGDPPANRGNYVKTSTVQYPTCMCYVPNSKILSSTYPRPKLSQCSPPSQVPVYVEKRMSPGEINTTDPWYTALTTGSGFPYSVLNTNYSSGKGTIDSTALGQLSSDWTRFTSRHRNGGFICFADGHVSWYSLDQVLSPPNIQVNIDDFNNPGDLVWNPFSNAP